MKIPVSFFRLMNAKANPPSTDRRRGMMSWLHSLQLLWLAMALLSAFASDGAQSQATGIPIRFRGRKPGFVAVSSQASGITFTNVLAQQRHLTNQILLNGSGVAAGDVDGDGLVDLYFCRMGGPNVLYRNLGNWRFADVTESAGVACPDLNAGGAVFADVDGDGDLDLLVSSIGQGTHLFLNDGRGHFTRSSFGPLNGRYGAASMALADLDGDGTLDLYIANYRTVTLKDQPNTSFKVRLVDGKPQVSSINGRPITDPELADRFEFRFGNENGRATFASDENGEPDAIFLNDGRGKFTPLSFTNGAFLDEDGRPLTKPPFDWGLSVMMRDLNGDGVPDIYVCNDFKSPDRIWINDGTGKFRAIARTAIRTSSFSSMGVDVADINRDGHFDIFVADMLSREHRHRLTQRPNILPDMVAPGDAENRVQAAHNTLLLARGDGTFAEVAQFAGIAAAEWAWTPIFLDVDLDGFEDLLISNGFERDGMNIDIVREIESKKTGGKLSVVEQLGLRKMFPRLDTPNVAFRNLGNLHFADVSEEWGFNARGVSQGMALADLDNDGDLDVIINNLNGPALLYRNECGAPRIAVRLKGNAPNTRGVGARITVTGGPVVQMQEMICGGRYLSSDDFMRVFAAGSETNRLRIEVTWRSGKRTVIEEVRPNRLYIVEEAAAVSVPQSTTESLVPMFRDVSAVLQHRHMDSPFDDFARQALMPIKLSRAGPGVSWFDVDGDGWEDLVIASGRGGELALFHNGGNGSFTRVTDPPLDQIVTRDQTTVLGWRRSSNDVVLLCGSCNYEDGLRNGSVVSQVDLATHQVIDGLPGQDSSAGPMAMADVDGDGNLDLFVGGRVIPGRYPEPASSLLFLNRGGQFVVDARNTNVLADVGLISGAVFSDIDGDGDPDLLLACEWGPIRVFRNDAGIFTEATRQLGFDRFPGWWNGIATGDFDGDGRLDIVASNWGENSKYEAYRTKPLRVYYGDFDGDGVDEIIESHDEPSLHGYAPDRNLDAMLRGMPWLRARFPTWKSFSEATVEQVLGDRFNFARMLEANWLSTTVFLNRGDHFEPVRLPDEAQFAPAFAICVADFDGDGMEDIFLSQNFFGTPIDTSRYDAGRGLMLRGDGHGGFKAVPGQETGIAVYGEQRGAATCDFDHDGRADLAVAQNGAETKLFRNTTAKPGLRVRLSLPGGNPHAVGAVIRIGDGDHFGPAREIHAGSGYFSQDAAIQVLAPSGGKIQIRWPGGTSTLGEIPAGANEIEVAADGAVKRVH